MTVEALTLAAAAVRPGLGLGNLPDDLLGGPSIGKIFKDPPRRLVSCGSRTLRGVSRRTAEIPESSRCSAFSVISLLHLTRRYFWTIRVCHVITGNSIGHSVRSADLAPLPGLAARGLKVATSETIWRSLSPKFIVDRKICRKRPAGSSRRG